LLEPALKGLQLVRADISSMTITKGVRSGTMEYGACMLIAPKSEYWYRESMLLDYVTPNIAKDPGLCGPGLAHEGIDRCRTGGGHS
jgi:hypothetical protein